MAAMSRASMAISTTWTDRREGPPTPASVASPSPRVTSETCWASATSRAVTEALAGDWRLRATWSGRRSIDSEAASSPQAATARAATSTAWAGDPTATVARSVPST